MACTIESLTAETERAFRVLKICLPDYGRLEEDASGETKMVMLLNDWHSPFEACNELVKRIETNESMLKKTCKAQGISFREIGYKPLVKDARELLQRTVVWHGENI